MPLKIKKYAKRAFVLYDQLCTLPVMFFYRLPVRTANENNYIIAEVK